MQYNEAHGIVPQTIRKEVRDILEISSKNKSDTTSDAKLSRLERMRLIDKLTKEMQNAARLLEFEHAAYLRDKIQQLREMK